MTPMIRERWRKATEEAAEGAVQPGTQAQTPSLGCPPGLQGGQVPGSVFPLVLGIYLLPFML